MEGFLENFESFIGVNFWTALFTLLNFLILFFVARRFLIGPILAIIESRQKEIDDMYSEAGNAKDHALALEEEYTQKLSAATETGERIVKEAVARGQAREDEIIRNANAEASAIMDKAAADIAQEKKKALNDAKDEISGMAIAIAEKVVGRELNAADQADLVDSFIAQLGENVLSRNLVLGTTLFSGGPLSLQPPYPILYPFLCFSHPETATWKKERRRFPSENAISCHIPSFNTKSYSSLQQPRTDFYIGIRQIGEHTYQ